MNIEDPKNIIVRMPNWLGDLVMATPVLTDLRKRFPDANITAMAIDGAADLLQFDPNINELYAFSRPSGFLRRKGERKIIDRIQKGNYDLGILLTNSFSSAWWFWRGNVTARLGFASDLRSLLLTEKVPFPEMREKQHLVDTYKMLLEPLGIPLSKSPPKLHVTEDEKRVAREALEKYGADRKKIVIGINPSAAYGPAKCWPQDRYKEVVKLLLEDERVFVVFFGDSKSSSLINSIADGFSSRVANLAGLTSLRELMALIASCDLFLTNDSGPMHIAAAFAVPLIAIFGSTNDIVTGPYLSGGVINKRVECAPCYLRTCPIDFRCMKSIEVKEVYNRLKEMIDVCKTI